MPMVHVAAKSFFDANTQKHSVSPVRRSLIMRARRQGAQPLGPTVLIHDIHATAFGRFFHGCMSPGMPWEQDQG